MQQQPTTYTTNASCVLYLAPAPAVKRKAKRGFALLSIEERKAAASKGGKSTVRKYGKKRMREIGRDGGKNSHGGHPKA